MSVRGTTRLRVEVGMELDSVVVEADGSGTVFFKCSEPDRHWLDDGLSLTARSLDWAALVGKRARVTIEVEQ